MNSLIEDYLAEVAAHLAALPVARRSEELREMRQHLTSTVEAHLKRGVTEQAAVEATLHQFGSSMEAARGLSNAWRRRQEPWLDAAKCGFIGAAALWSTLATCTLLGQYVAARSNSFTALLSPHLQPIFYILLYGLSALMGCLLRKRYADGTIKAMAWGTVLGYVAPLVIYEIVTTGNDSDIAPVLLIVLLQAVVLTAVARTVGWRQRPTLLARR